MARTGRRPGRTETREEILAAARTQFAEFGYDGATIRGIAAAADVNPALVHHYFGAKEKVFVAALELPVDPATVVPQLLDGPRSEFGERLVRLFLGLWRDPETRKPFLAIIRSAAANEGAARMMRQFVEKAVLIRVADGLGVPRLRLTGAAAQMLGLVMLRHIIGIEPLASTSEDELAALVAPVVQYYIDALDPGRT
jgi:AcrR family transcriptional regulator